MKDIKSNFVTITRSYNIKECTRPGINLSYFSLILDKKIERGTMLLNDKLPALHVSFDHVVNKIAEKKYEHFVQIVGNDHNPWDLSLECYPKHLIKGTIFEYDGEDLIEEINFDNIQILEY